MLPITPNFDCAFSQVEQRSGIIDTGVRKVASVNTACICSATTAFIFRTGGLKRLARVHEDAIGMVYLDIISS